MSHLSHIAYVLYPRHKEITFEDFSAILTLYFIRLNKMSSPDKNRYFKLTYHSNGNITWMKYNNFIYFAIALNPGSRQETYYYGRQNTL